MKAKLLISLLLAASALAQQASTRADLEPLVRRALPNCESEIKLTQEELKMPLPSGFVGKLFLAQSDSIGCSGRHAAVLSPRGNFYLGSPWPISELTGTPAERIRAFALKALEESFTPSVSTQKNDDGLLSVELAYNIEGGKITIQGWVDPAGTTFFPGVFHPVGGDITRIRLEKLASLLSKSPARGPAGAPVSLVEFSDFQCPSCKASAAYVKPLLEKYDGRVRYTRVDYPLVGAHPWAFGAAVIGRAIHRQDPDLFWKFKDAVYESQASLNLFTLEDFARGFVSDHDLNLESFNTAIASEEIRKQILESISLGQSLQVQGTPTFLVNGQTVAPGTEGKHLEATIQKALNANVVGSQ